ncbi:hypothetical protein GGH99_003176 [Coemansia sp. RSA 1285]|nr:hypothetical protein GGH99_003176 [Coemansia sp. RSA 1285]
MEAEIPASSHRAFYKALQCLSRIGTEISFEARAHELKLIGYNAARSAYALFVFPAGFFDAYEVELSPSSHLDPAFRCRVLAKLLVGIFKLRGPSPGHAVERCILRIEQAVDPVHVGRPRRQQRTPSASGNSNNGERDPSEASNAGSGECRLVVHMEYKQGICRTHRLYYEVCETLHSSYSKDECKNRWRVNSKVANGWISHFSRGLEELSMWMTGTHVHVRSWADGNYTGTSRTQVDAAIAETTRALRTEITVDTSEFDVYNLASANHPVELTFGFREFKAILQYAEAMGLPISAYFDKGGDPLLINVGILRQVDPSMRGGQSGVLASEDAYAEFVLATISDYATPSYNTTDAPASVANKERITVESNSSYDTPQKDIVQIQSFTPREHHSASRSYNRHRGGTIEVSGTEVPQQVLICERVDEVSLHSEERNNGGTQDIRRSAPDSNSVYDIVDPKIVPSPSTFHSSRASNSGRDHEWNSMDFGTTRSNAPSARGTPSSSIGRRATTANADMRTPPLAHATQFSSGVRAGHLAASQTPASNADRDTSVRSYRLLDMPRPNAPPGVTDSWDGFDDAVLADEAPAGMIQTKLPFQQAAAAAAAAAGNGSSEQAALQANNDDAHQDSNTDMSSDEEVEATPPPPSKRLRSLF